MAKTMKAAFFRKTGGPEVIEWGDLPIPEINDNEVLVKTSAVALDHDDTYLRSGKYTPAQPFPAKYIIGKDVVGIVEQIGKNVHELKPGQRVWSNVLGLQGRQGSFAEYVSGNSAIFNRVPDNVDDINMAAVLQSGVTVCHGIIRIAKLQANEIIFVNGAGGAVGSALVQLASARGARVFASTTGREKLEWCKRNGAEWVIDYKSEDLIQKIKEVLPDGVDVFWDTSRHPDFDLSVSLISVGGRIILMAGNDAHPPFPVGAFYRKDATLRGFSIMNASLSELKDYADIINRCVQEKRLASKIANVLPLSEAAKAHALLESNPGLWGKIILK